MKVFLSLTCGSHCDWICRFWNLIGFRLHLHVPTLSLLPVSSQLRFPSSPVNRPYFITPPTPHTPQPAHFTMSRRLSDGRSCMALRRLFCASAAWLSWDPSVPPSLLLSASLRPRLPLGLPLATGQKKTPPIIWRGRLREPRCCCCLCN